MVSDVESFDTAIGNLRVNVFVKNMCLLDAKNMIEKHFGKLFWPAASGGATKAYVENGISIEIRTGE